MLISADPDTEQLDRGTASAGCGPGAAGKPRVRSLDLTGMAVMVAPGSDIGRVMQRATRCLPGPTQCTGTGARVRSVAGLAGDGDRGQSVSVPAQGRGHLPACRLGDPVRE